VERVQGSMSTVIGLPLAPTAHLLRVLGAARPE
jgi:predicted house-cleaning NTP pyrophosphatase (Maf/HAM1 superfamily)